MSAKLSDFAELLGEPETLIVTGITLALCSPESFECLCEWVRLHRSQSHVVFDCNFRPALWQSAEQARERIGRFEGLATFIATGLEDEQLLWGIPDAQGIIERLSMFSGERVLRGGSRGCWVGTHKHWIHVPAEPVASVDTVGAGDAHLAGYIAARVAGHMPADAASFANRVAAVIVRQQGSMPAEDTVLPRLPARPGVNGSARVWR